MASIEQTRDPLSSSWFQAAAQNHDRQRVGPHSGDKIKLLMMLTNFKIGGTERQVTNLALRIDPSRFELHLACMHNSGELRQEIETLQVPRPVFRIGRLYALRTFWQALRLIRYIRVNAIEIVHSYGYYPNVFAVPAARLAGASIVIASIRDRGDVLTPFHRRLQKLVCRLADCVLVNAEAIRETLIEQGYRPDNIVVIRNGVALPRPHEKQERAALRRELGFSPSAPIVMVFSRLNPMKGIEYFLDAAAIVASRIAEARFLIVGDGANRPELERYAAHLGLGDRIAFTGFRTDGPDLLLEASVSVLPSLSEGLSNSLLESMASGIPVIAARVGGNPEIIEDGVSGLLIPPRDAVSLAGAIITILEHRGIASQFGEAGRRRVTELFSMERSVGEVEGLYQHLVETRVRI
jgi:glycosyltransferase involved in cell wall biosynthesis